MGGRQTATERLAGGAPTGLLRDSSNPRGTTSITSTSPPPAAERLTVKTTAPAAHQAPSPQLALRSFLSFHHPPGTFSFFCQDFHNKTLSSRFNFSSELQTLRKRKDRISPGTWRTVSVISCQLTSRRTTRSELMVPLVSDTSDSFSRSLVSAGIFFSFFTPVYQRSGGAIVSWVSIQMCHKF